MTRVLLIGFDPSLVDLSAAPGLTAETIRTTLDRELAAIRAAGYDARWLLTDTGETAEAVVRAALAEQAYDIVLIGAGIRVLPPYFEVFERLINAVHEGAPRAKICFNTKPDDTLAAVERWGRRA